MTSSRPRFGWLVGLVLALGCTAQPPAAALQMLHHSHIIRAFEETGLELVNEGLVHGPWHCSAGQEGGAVGAMSVLRPEDQIAGAHRGHHLFLAKAIRYTARPSQFANGITHFITQLPDE